MAEKVLDIYSERIENFTLIPGQGGVFEIAVNGQLQFSKKDLGRFPEDKEIFALIEAG